VLENWNDANCLPLRLNKIQASTNPVLQYSNNILPSFSNTSTLHKSPRHEVPTAYSRGCQPTVTRTRNSSRVAATEKWQEIHLQKSPKLNPFTRPPKDLTGLTRFTGCLRNEFSPQDRSCKSFLVIINRVSRFPHDLLD
jgi:hypothetical protein